MHEFSYAQALVENALRIAESKKAKKVKKVVVEIGSLLLINPEQLRFCYEVITKNTILDGSELEIINSEALLICESCGRKYKELTSVCECGGFLKVESGDEFVLRRIVMEVEDAQN
ncbi:hydrogenase nickel insertion protein HypA [Ferroglobus placidus DSM 10642]|uniref:Hydrogenase maturation factor HypA n=1 Tax=Ferroglobus placidus (strain DSM 10642 / AEDII12DO) TaxID=589924 RepID=D3RZN3_FERPA|nr:hydrogenase maturation nickel metallochaperone HypA [Ferroglobus placidus]ADC65946.1 hydrogenase nickel insertion protein HypA [Ferroglobus placidus DSM 10642]